MQPITTSTSTRDNSSTIPGIHDALAQIRNLKLGDKLVYTAIAKDHGVDRSTVRRRHQRGQVPLYVANQQRRKLTPQQEAELVRYIEELTARHLPPTRRMVRNFASVVAQNPCSDSWVTRFLSRHRNPLTSQWVTGMDSNRHNAEFEYKYKLYFDMLLSVPG